LNTVFSKNFFEPFTTTSKGIFSKNEKSIAFSGIGQVLDPNNQYVFPILRAEQTTFSYNQEKNSGEYSKISGEALTLVSGYQTRNNQRVSISGSLSMCSNDNIHLTLGSQGGLESSANFKFCQELYQWTFQQRGVLKLSQMKHHKVRSIYY
jgi:oligosaccharyltransferase complex subunit beta